MMKLKSATAYAVLTPPPNLGGMFWYFVRLETDNGLVGWGECAVLFSMYGLDRSFAQLVEDNFERYLKDKNPLNREALTKLMYEGFTSQSPGYFSSGIISAFDLAMWDICGKHFDAPICDLLGGRYRERIRTYTYIYSDLAEGTMISTTGDWRDNPDGVAEAG
ncbi:MAG: hypothetical protein VX252_10290, partial [Myxococcota bacterium]|nr:hypothetical protein [Myxococcota bacterium]